MNLTGFDICEDHTAFECILFGFPGQTNNSILINYCILYAKFYIYTQTINNNNYFEFLCYLPVLKNGLLVEENICKANNQ